MRQSPSTTSVNVSDKLSRVTMWGCSECLLWATNEAWNDAWDAEFKRREDDPAYAQPGEWGARLGLDDRMVCPRCTFVHADTDCSCVDEELVVVRVEREPGA